MKKFFKKKFIIPIIIVLVIVFMAVTCGKQAGSIYEEEGAEVRDIITYHNFSGNVEVVHSKNVVSQVSQQIIELLVEEGDSVKEGDVIAVLDSDALQQNIDLSEVSLSTSELSNYYNIRDAQKSYNDFKSSLDAGLNPQINAAKASKDGAYSQALLAQRAYDEAVAAYEVSEQYIAAKTAYDTAKAQYESLLAQYQEADEAAKPALETAVNEAKAMYDNAAVALNTLNEAKDASVRTLSDAVLTAITAYDTACKNYDATVQQVNQTLETYKNAVEKVGGLSTTESSKMQLDNLYSQLEDYTIKASMDGVITSLRVKEGSMVTAGMDVAEISDFSKLKIAIKIDEYDILGVEPGKDVDIYIDALEKNYAGKITKISKTATNSGGVSYFEAEVEFEADELVRSGMTVEVKLISREAYGVVSVSMDALRYEKDNTAYVLVRNAEGKEEKKYVTVGITDGNYVEIKEGLSKGDIVLVSPSIPYMQMMMEME